MRAIPRQRRAGGDRVRDTKPKPKEITKNEKVSEKYQGQYLKAAHLQGRAVRVQISHVEEDVPMGKEGEPKDVVHFKGPGSPGAQQDQR